MPFSQVEIEEEQAHFSNVIQTFKNYAAYSLSANNRRRKDFFTLPRADQELLDSLGYKAKLAEADRAIRANAEFLNEIVANPEIFGHEVDEEEPGEHVPDDDTGPSHPHSHGHTRGPHSHLHPHSHSHNAPGSSHGHSDPGKQKKYRPTDFDMDKLRSTLKQFVRDWSEEGRAEREVCYAPMREALLEHFSDIHPEERRNFRVLVPGAGLGRLAWDVADLGFSCQGNEFSHYMLLASFFILNRTDSINQHTIYPYVHSFSNLPSNTAMLRPITIPDVMPSSLPQGSNFSLVAGDFEEIYGADDNHDEPQGGQWDAVLTCFFIDTAKNFVNYLRIIHRILAPGGVWINLGPLLWHWENNSTNDPSIELSLEEVKALARKIGFEISNERTIDTTYTNNAQSMLGYVYHAAFWTAKKVI
ncbi:N2227-domain-containing protein [Daedalea quercina L-15889]|uniref:carnosine N-methyltransferase n=1 Tax=Daedalea quercina L-15889 TaxID=1314783 RepID=A0A165LY92_9APHY|nr:N2227-domain-containing protein [Daedalea quercina L-15889]